MDQSFVFPVPLPVIMNKEKETEDQTLEELQKQTVIMLDDSDKSEEWLTQAMIDSKEEKKKRKQETVWGKLQEKVMKQWDKLGIGKYFKNLFGKIGVIAGKIGGMMGGFLSGLFNDLMELMLFAAVDPNGGLLASFIGAIIPLFLNLIFMIANVLVNVLPMIIKMVISYIPMFVKAFFMVFDAIINAIPMIVDAFIIAVPILFNAIMKAVPKIITTLAQAVLKIVSSIKDKIPFFKPILDFIESFSNALMALFDPSGGELKERIYAFANSVFESLYTFFTSGIFGLTEDIKKALKETFPQFEKLIDFIWNFVKVLAIVGAVVGAILLGIKLFGIITALIAAWPIVLIVALVALVALMITYWDDVKNYLSEVWDGIQKKFFSALEFIQELFFDIVDIVITGVRLLLLPFTWPIELGLLLYKNWNKISKRISTAIDFLLDLIGKVFGTDIKKKIKSSLESIKNYIKSFSIGDMVRNTLASAFSNIPGLNTIREFFTSLLNKIQNSKIGKWLLKLSGGSDKELSSGASSIQGVLDLSDRKSEFIKNMLQTETFGEALRQAAMKAGAGAEEASKLDELIGELRRQATAQGKDIKNLVVSSDPAQLEALEKIARSVSNSKALGVIKSSNTMK